MLSTINLHPYVVVVYQDPSMAQSSLVLNGMTLVDHALTVMTPAQAKEHALSQLEYIKKQTSFRTPEEIAAEQAVRRCKLLEPSLKAPLVFKFWYTTDEKG